MSGRKELTATRATPLRCARLRGVVLCQEIEMSKSWSSGSTTAWRKTRMSVLARAKGLCRLRIKGVCTVNATHVHHTLGRSVSGDDINYLVSACASCNLHIGDPTKSADPKPTPITKW